MKIATKIDEHFVLLKSTIVLFVLAFGHPAFCNSYECENDLIDPTIEFPNFSGLASGDTIFLACSSSLISTIRDEAEVQDNCDTDPLVEFREECIAFGDCSRGYNYLAEYNWVAIDKNNNVANYTIYAAIRDKTPPSIQLNWGDGISSGDTIIMECGYSENFDESFVTTTDDCGLSMICEGDETLTDVFFREQIVSQGECQDYLTEMYCSWTATDGCGNMSVFELVVFLTDTTPPEFVDVPDHFCGSASLTEEEFQDYRKDLSEIEVKDRCGNTDLQFTIDDLSDGCDYFIQWEATDDCGNKGYHQQHVCIISSACVGNISGTVQLDNDKDNIGDEPIPAVQLLLVEDINGNGQVDGGETVYSTTETDENGFYKFVDIPQGCYVIVELQPNGLFDASDKDVTNPGDTDRDGANDPTDNLIPVCIGPGEFDDGNDFVEKQIILDVLLTSFEGSYNKIRNEVDLNWQTAHETASDHFIVERSIDGSNFLTVDQKNSKGESAISTTYVYTDKILPSSSILYYRLREVSTNGESSYSDIISLEINGRNNDLLVYPNPSTGVLSVSFNDQINGESTSIEVYDITGSLVFSRQEIADNMQLDLSDLITGTYLLRLNSSNKTTVKKVVLVD